MRLVLQIFVQLIIIFKPSCGGLEVEAWTDNSLHSASVGLNPSVYGVLIARVI